MTAPPMALHMPLPSGAGTAFHAGQPLLSGEHFTACVALCAGAQQPELVMQTLLLECYQPYSGSILQYGRGLGQHTCLRIRTCSCNVRASCIANSSHALVYHHVICTHCYL